MSASNCEPMIPTFTFPLLDITFLISTAELVTRPSRRDDAPFRTKLTGCARMHEYRRHCIRSTRRGTEYLLPVLFPQSVQTNFLEVEWTPSRRETAATS